MNANSSGSLRLRTGLVVSLILALSGLGWGMQDSQPGTATNAPLPDAPPRLLVTRIDVDSFMIKWRSHSPLPTTGFHKTGPVWTNDPPIGSTNAYGFVVLAITNKFEYKRLPGSETPQKVNVSEMTLKRGNLTVVLVRDVDEELFAHTAHLHAPDVKKDVTLKIDEEFELAGRRFRLTRINLTDSTCTIVDVRSGRSYLIKKKTPPRRD